jgi:menaquinone-dependent protoporphyrinogen oxidase
MKVLITAATRHGSTFEIASGIEDVLHNAGIETVLTVPERVTDLTGYDAVILGSAVYAGHWLEPAKQFASRNLSALLTRPVWLFSSGPTGDPAKPAEEPADAARVREATCAREHRLFSGRLERRDLGLAEKAIVSVIRAPVGDFRSWTQIEAWAMMIARTLQAEQAAATANVAEAAKRPMVATR